MNILDRFGTLRSGTPATKPSFVYVIRNAELGLYKIGFTESVERRLKQLSKESSFHLDVLVAWRVPDTAARTFEWCAHEKYKHLRSHGEWYHLDDEIVSDMLDTTHWAIYARRSHPPLQRPQPAKPNPYHTHLL